MKVDETENAQHRKPDSLAEIVRTVGRREPPPKAHYDQVRTAARGAWKQAVRSRQRKRRLYAFAASIAVLAVAGGMVQWWQGPDVPAIAELSRGTVEIQSARGLGWQRTDGGRLDFTPGMAIRAAGRGGAALELRQGGSLRLGAETEIRILDADAFELVVGKLYFDSIGRPAPAAIEIRTRLGVVRDVGTQFEVRLDPQSLRVRVREGEVRLTSPAAQDDISGRISEEIELTAGGRVERATIPPDSSDWAWAEALASVPLSGSQSILGYLRWIARETGKRLEFERPGVELAADLARLTGDARGLKPIEILEFIAATSDFNYLMTDDGAILIGRD